MRARAITAFRLFCAARRWPAASREAFVRKFAGGSPGLAAEVSALLATAAPAPDFLAPPLRLRPAGEATDDGALVGRRVLSRYRVDRVLDVGGASTVYAAYDEVARGPAAVKVLRRALAGRGARLEAVRREVACLRLLRLPGVVQLLDDGIEADRYVLAMELVEGLPFPGVAGVVPWRRIASPTLSLVECLARVHAVGVVHGDLKPRNVLVRPDGLPVVLDLGISGGPAIDRAWRAKGPASATPRWMSPEAARGDAVGPASDLHAVGLLVYEALSGRLPHAEGAAATFRARRGTARPPPLASVAPTVEPEVAAWVDALLDPDPAARAQAAAAALSSVPGYVALPDRVLALRARDPAGAVPRPEVEALFHGPRAIHHLPDDAAEALLARTDGTPGGIVAELVAWVRAGLARWEGGGVAVDRAALERLRLRLGGGLGTWAQAGGGVPGAAGDGAAQRAAHVRVAEGSPPGSPERLYDRVAAGDLVRASEEAERLAQAEADVGRSEAALHVLDEGLRAAERLGDAALLERLLVQAVGVALDLATVQGFDRLLYRFALVRSPSPRVHRLEAIARAARLYASGDGEAAERRLDDARAEDDDDPRVVRGALQVRARAGERVPLSRHEATLARIEGVVARFGGREALFELDAWRGWLRYRQGRYAEAVELYHRAAASTTRPIRRIAHLCMAAGSGLELHALDGVERDARAALELLHTARHPWYESLAIRALRAAAYRREEALDPRPELVEGATLLSASAGAGTALVEAAFAWRRGDVATARELLAPACTPAYARWFPSAFALTASFLYAIGELRGVGSEDELLRSALEASYPGFCVQACGFLARRRPELVRPHAAFVVAQAARLPKELEDRRREVLSVAESLAYVTGAWTRRGAAPG